MVAGEGMRPGLEVHTMDFDRVSLDEQILPNDGRG
jgi:hypothetical protein